MIAAWASTSTAAAATFLKGYGETKFAAADSSERRFWFERSANANSSLARINLSWRTITAGEPVTPANPADPAYQFARIDEAVTDAAVSGHRVLLTVYDAPAFAEGPNRPTAPEYPPGTWKPDPAALSEFAQAVATRYSGSFPSPGPTALPRVQYIAAWNEPNLTEYITPQSVNGKLFSSDHYRRMVNAFSDGVARSANPGAQVVTGGTAPYGDPIGGRRTRPLQFWRDVFCLKKNLKPNRCNEEANFDILAHHPITLSGGPNRSAIHRDDVAMPDFKNLVKTLRSAEKRNTIAGGRHAAWATEFWWETNPPDPHQGHPLAKHARWVQESLYSLWRQGADGAIWLQLLDDEPGPDGFSGLQAGQFFLDRSQKPAYQAFRFPFVADRVSKKEVNVWTVAPTTGTLEIQAERGGGFQTIKRMGVTEDAPEQTMVKLKGKPSLRGLLAGEQTLPYVVK